MKAWTWKRPDGTFILATMTTTKSDAELCKPRDAETRGFTLVRVEVKEAQAKS